MTRNEQIRELVSKLFKSEDGSPFILTDSQCELFDLIFSRKYPRSHVMCFTRFGKSVVIAMAVLLRAATFPEKWAIVAGTKEKAKIIMDYIIKHLYDNQYTVLRFERDKNETDEEIQRQRNKSRLNFRLGKDASGKILLGEIYICSAQEALGFGAENVVEDESSLISDDDHSMVLRMLGDKMDNFLCKIGNPMRRNHFLRSFLDPNYHKIDIDFRRGLIEGRVNMKFIEEQRRDNKIFTQLYANKFPGENEIDDKGWMNLFYELELSQVQQKSQPDGIPRMGVDVGHGGDSSVWTIRWKNYATILREDHDDNVINVALKTKFLADKLKIPHNNIFIDGTGLGTGVVDYLQRNEKMPVNRVIFGKQAHSPDFLNLRAESYWRLSKWLSNGHLEPDKRWLELLTIKYRIQKDKKIMIMPKDLMRKEGFDSPNCADSLALTFSISDQFYETTTVKSKEELELEQYRKEQKYGRRTENNRSLLPR